MVNIKTFRQIVLQWENVKEQPHFKKVSFRIDGKKIFATLDEHLGKVVVKLTEVDQSVFCQIDPTVIYPVPGNWGKQGWTVVELLRVKKSVLHDMLLTSYQNMAPKRKLNRKNTPPLKPQSKL